MTDVKRIGTGRILKTIFRMELEHFSVEKHPFINLFERSTNGVARKRRKKKEKKNLKKGLKSVGILIQGRASDAFNYLTDLSDP